MEDMLLHVTKFYIRIYMYILYIYMYIIFIDGIQKMKNSVMIGILLREIKVI
jgi:hypothetical protein